MKYYILAQFLRNLNHEDNKCLKNKKYVFIFALNFSAKLIHKQWRSYGMAGMARAMGATLKGAQKLVDKNLNFYLQFLETLFCVPYNQKLQNCINTALPYLMSGV